jgi:methionyl aminopeptidase
MKILSHKNNLANKYITLKDREWLDLQIHAGKCISILFSEINNYLKKDNISLKDLENLALIVAKQFNCEPTFLNYKGFPSAICTSVNKQLVHGIATNYILQDGDLISVDVGMTYNGVIADAARTWIYGTPKSNEHVRMIDVCKNALDLAIDSVAIGKQIGCIGNAIHKYVSSQGFSIITDYGGHGIGLNNQPHCDPFISNKSEINEGIRITPGLSIAIEPMIVIGDAKTEVANDGWTVYTPDYGCHFEDSITIMDDGIYNTTRDLFKNF